MLIQRDETTTNKNSPFPAFLASCKKEWGTEHSWGFTQDSLCELVYLGEEEVSVWDVVSDLNAAYVRAKADRNV